MDLAERLEEVRARIAAAAARAGRSPDEITLVAVTKTVPAGTIRRAWELGVRHVGENRAQELKAKQPLLADLSLAWHFVGRLQTNKVRDVVGRVDLIHSLDRWPLAEAIDGRARRLGLRQDCLVQVNVTGEPTKAGLPPEEVLPFLERVAELPGIRVRGLMTIGPLTGGSEAARAAFRRLRGLAERLRREAPPRVELRHLSMGMTGDFEVAIEEGATIVRIGTAIFGERPAEGR